MAAAVGQVDPERIRAVLERFPAVVAGFLSGSVARGGQTPLSDIDVAVGSALSFLRTSGRRFVWSC